MRAIGIETFEAGPVSLDLAVPLPGPGDVLVRVSHASVNGFDVAVAAGMVKDMMEHRFPVVLGKDFAGTVEVVGEGVTTVAVGDEVFGVLMRPYIGDGTFADYVLVPEAIGLAKIPSGLDRARAGALGLAGSAAHAAIEAVAPSAGEAILVSGATGGVGAMAIQLAVARGAEVIATARPGRGTDFAKQLGAAYTVDHTGDLAAQVRAIRPEGVNAAVHFAGDAMALVDLVTPGGRFASTLGVGPDQFAGKEVLATAVNAMPTPAVLNGLATAVAAGTLQVPITRTYKLEEAPQALKDFTKGSLGKFALTIGA
jgi:NADPH:quinone reductase-like Zn-dependent oxidoreductase